MKKNIYIGVGLLAVGALGYLALKNKRKKEEQQLIEAESEADFDFENADGKKKTGLQNIISKPKKIIKVKDYQALLRNGTIEQINEYLFNKNIYTLNSNVTVVNKRDNLVFQIKNKGVFIGKVYDVFHDSNGKIWIKIDFRNTNPAFEKYFNWVDRYVKADTVVVDLY